jgi:hypothetical protein
MSSSSQTQLLVSEEAERLCSVLAPGPLCPGSRTGE